MKKFIFVMPLMAISLLASCGKNKEPAKTSYTLTYTYDNGSDDKYVETYAEDKKTEKPTWQPIYPNYTFDGWFTKPGKEGSLFTFGNVLTDNTMIYAHWSEKPTPETTYTITFKNDGDEDKKLENITAGSLITDNIPTPSKREGSTFIGWCTDEAGENVFDFNTIKIYQNYTLYAGWEDDEPTFYKVTFDACDGNYSAGKTLSIDVESGTKLSSLLKIVEVPTLTDKIFAYYKYDEKEDLIAYDDKVTGDITLKAQYFDANKVKLDTLDFTWKEIKQVAVTNKDPSTCFKVGATKKVKVNEKDHTVRIIDFRHEGDVTKDGNQIGITFEFANVITASDGTKAIQICWNDKDLLYSTNYDFPNSTLNNLLNDETSKESIINMLPTDSINIDLKEVIEPVDKKVGLKDGESYIAKSFGENFPKLFPLAYDEIHDPQDPYITVTPNEASGIYKYYEGHGGVDGNAYRIKNLVDGDAWPYWLRSPNAQDKIKAFFIDAGGDIWDDKIIYDQYRLAIAPAFCI